jgi:hypothetical protein
MGPRARVFSRLVVDTTNIDTDFQSDMSCFIIVLPLQWSLLSPTLLPRQDLARDLPEMLMNDYFFHLVEGNSTRILEPLAYCLLSNIVAGKAMIAKLNPDVKHAIQRIRDVAAGMLGLVTPRPGVLGIIPSDSTRLMEYSGEHTMEQTLSLTLKGSHFWQGRADEILKKGASTLKSVEEIEAHFQAIKTVKEASHPMEEHAPLLKKAFKFISTGRDKLRDGALSELEDLMLSVLKDLAKDIPEVEWGSAEIPAPLPTALIACVQEGLNLFAVAEGVSKLMADFKKWQESQTAEIAVGKAISFLKGEADRSDDVTVNHADLQAIFPRGVLQAVFPMLPADLLAHPNPLPAESMKHLRKVCNKVVKQLVGEAGLPVKSPTNSANSNSLI